MPDVLIGQAYFLRFDPKLWRAQQPYAPLGTLYAAAHLREAGHSVALFDAMLAESVDEWAADLDAHRPRIAVIYEDSFNYLSKMCLSRMREAAKAMTAAARARGCPVAISGSDATDHPDIYLDAGASFVLVGEGEITLTALIHACLSESSPRAIEGLAFLDDAGRVVRTPPRPFVRTLDTLPPPAWDLVDVPRYRQIWQRRHGYHAMNLATTRGCPFQCNWCAKPIYGQRYAVRSPEHVVDEIARLARDYQPDRLNVVDDVFGLQPGWIDRFAAHIDRRGVRVPYRCLMRADQIDPDVVRGLAASGCHMVWMGAESGSQRILDAMDKGTRVEQIREGARLLQGAGIDVGLFLQFGYPGEEWVDVQATLQLVRDVGPDDIGVSVSYPLPGTKFFERVRHELGAKQNWLDSDDLALMYRGTYAPEFYRVLHQVVHHDFRARRRRKAASIDVAAQGAIAGLRQLLSRAYHRSALPFAERALRRAAVPS
jgi:anaerobic magnesium-protoporphyrin IX monomethyl ester cyclase